MSYGAQKFIQFANEILIFQKLINGTVEWYIIAIQSIPLARTRRSIIAGGTENGKDHEVITNVHRANLVSNL